MEFLNKYGAAILTAIAALVAVILLCIVFWGLKDLIPLGERALPLVAIGGVVVLILLLTAVATMFSILGLTNGNQAMGLPEGSIRAVIALSLIVLFAILSIFLYQNVSAGGALVTISRLSDTDRIQFIRDHTNLRDIQSNVVKDSAGEPLVFKDGAGKPISNADGTPKYVYDLSYRSTNPTSEDFAKQLLILLGTLMTAITSFYLGAGTATSAVRAGSDVSGTSAALLPTLSSIKPTTHSLASETPLRLEINGANLNDIKHVRIAKTGNDPIIGTNVKSSATGIACEFDVSRATSGVWDVEVDDGGSKSAKLQGALTITT